VRNGPVDDRYDAVDTVRSCRCAAVDRMWIVPVAPLDGRSVG
jgi:hypothetical protein